MGAIAEAVKRGSEIVGGRKAYGFFLYDCPGEGLYACWYGALYLGSGPSDESNVTDSYIEGEIDKRFPGLFDALSSVGYFPDRVNDSDLKTWDEITQRVEEIYYGAG